mgnify:CR=1 FL=1
MNKNESNVYNLPYPNLKETEIKKLRLELERLQLKNENLKMMLGFIALLN